MILQVHGQWCREYFGAHEGLQCEEEYVGYQKQLQRQSVWLAPSIEIRRGERPWTRQQTSQTAEQWTIDAGDCQCGLIEQTAKSGLSPHAGQKPVASLQLQVGQVHGSSDRVAVCLLSRQLTDFLSVMTNVEILHLYR